MRKLVYVVLMIICLSGLVCESPSFAGEKHVMPVQDEYADVEYFQSGGNLHLRNNGDEGVIYFSCVVVNGCGPTGVKSIPEGCQFANPFNGSYTPDEFYSQLGKWNTYYLAPGEKTTVWVRSCYKNVRFQLYGFPAEDMRRRDLDTFVDNMQRVNRGWGFRSKMYFR